MYVSRLCKKINFNRAIGKTSSTLPKKIFKWPISTCKDTQHHQSIENWKLKPQWEIKNTNIRMAKIV